MFGIGVLPTTNKPPRPSTALKNKKVKEENKEPVRIKRPQSSRLTRNSDQNDSLINNNQQLSAQDSNEALIKHHDDDNCITNMIRS